jgi:hypothetical protein
MVISFTVAGDTNYYGLKEYFFRVSMVCTSSFAMRREYPLISALRMGLSFRVTFSFSLGMFDHLQFSRLWFKEDDTSLRKVRTGRDSDQAQVRNVSVKSSVI